MKEKTSKITDLLALTVFAVFAVCILMVLLTSAGVYRNLVRAGAESGNARTADRYITTRVRQAQTITVEDFGGCQALVIPEETDGDVCITRVYCCGGYIRELYSLESAVLSPEDGEKIAEAEQLSFTLEDGLLTVALDDRQLLLSIPGGREVAP